MKPTATPTPDALELLHQKLYAGHPDRLAGLEQARLEDEISRRVRSLREDAGLTQAPAGMEVTAVEYKINFLAAFEGGELRATGRVVRAGKRVMVTSAEVMHVDADGQERACALMQQTLMPVPRSY